MAPRGRRAPETTFDEVAFRWTDYDVPFWARNNTQPGRWHRSDDGPTQYLSVTPEAAWAELIRAENLRDESELELVRIPLWVAKINQARLVDYRIFDRAEAAGFPPDALIDEDKSRCQDEGRRLRDLGYQGVLSPSAALAGGLSLTLFGGRVAVSWDAAPSLASAIPAKVLSRGAPPPELLALVRYQGRAHEGLLAYEHEKREARIRAPRRRPKGE
jgi:hypothetical protein